MQRTIATTALLLSVVPFSADAQFRTIDGSNNNSLYPDMGKAGTALQRHMPEHYSDHVSAMGGVNLKSPREISNIVSDQPDSIRSHRRATDFVWQWGQFLDHDIDLTPHATPIEYAGIPVPIGDQYFDPFGTGTQTIHFERSVYDIDTGLSPENPRQQINAITSWIDASNVYGSDEVRAAALRTLDGTGRLKTSTDNLLPFNEAGLPNAGGSHASLFLAGDERANEQVGLTALHTLFVREHNRIADRLVASSPNLDGDQIYQRARRLVGGQMQAITYNEFLPALLGQDALEPYNGYQRHTDARIMNEFSTAAYRFGHSMLNENLMRIGNDGLVMDALPLRDAFFAPTEITSNGIEPILRGLARQRAQRIDPFLVDSVRNFLFGPPGSGGLDLASLNIQRGRDHGMPSYNDARESMGLPRTASFADVTSNRRLQRRLMAAYDHVDDIELWVGCLAEDTYARALVGELAYHILKKQFELLRDGDRYWYERQFAARQVETFRSTSLADIIRRNTTIDEELPDNVFRALRPSQY